MVPRLPRQPWLPPGEGGVRGGTPHPLMGYRALGLGMADVRRGLHGRYSAWPQMLTDERVAL